MTTLPRLAPIVTCTAVSRWSDEQLLELEQPGRSQPGGRRQPGAVGDADRRRVTVESSARLAPDRLLDHPHRPVLGARLRASCSWKARSGVPSSARACPALRRPSATRCWIAGGSWNSRKRVGDRGSALADPVGDLLVGQLEVLDQLLIGGGLLERVRSWRWRFSTRACSTRPRSSASRTIAGIGRQAGPLGRPPAALAGDRARSRSPSTAAPGPAGARRSRGSRRSARQRLLVEVHPGLMLVRR